MDRHRTDKRQSIAPTGAASDRTNTRPAGSHRQVQTEVAPTSDQSSHQQAKARDRMDMDRHRTDKRQSIAPTGAASDRTNTRPADRTDECKQRSHRHAIRARTHQAKHAIARTWIVIAPTNVSPSHRQAQQAIAPTRDQRIAPTSANRGRTDTRSELAPTGEARDRTNMDRHRTDKRLDPSPPYRRERDDLVVKPGEASLVFANQLRLEGALAVPGDVDRHRAVVRQDGLAAGAIAVIGGELGLSPPRRVAQMVTELGTEGALISAFLNRRGAVSTSAAVSGPSRTIGRECQQGSAPESRRSASRALVCGAYRLLMLCPTHKISDTLPTTGIGGALTSAS